MFWGFFVKTFFSFPIITCEKDAKYLKNSETGVVNYASCLKSIKVLTNDRSQPLGVGCGVEPLRCFNAPR